MKPTNTRAGVAVAFIARCVVAALVFGGSIAISHVALAADPEPTAAEAEAKAKADAEAKAEADRQALQKKREDLIALFEKGKDLYRKDDLDAAETTFKKVEAELKTGDVSINSLFVRRDPQEMLKKIADRRAELAASKVEAAARAEAEKDEQKAAAEKEARAAKRRELIALYDAGKAQLKRGELDAAEATFKKVEAELKTSGVSISSLFVRRDPTARLAEIAEKRQAAADAEATAKAEAERKAQEEAERKAREEAEAKAEAERKAREEAEAKAEAERKAKEEAERKKREEAMALFNAAKKDFASDNLDAAEEGFKKVKEMGVDLSTFWYRNDPDEWLQAVADRRRELAEAKAEAERKAQEEAMAKAEAERKAKEEAERKAREEAMAKAEAERKAQEEAERKAREEAEAKAEAERNAKAEAERKAREEAEAKAEAERKAKEEAERKKREEAMALFNAAKNDFANDNLDAAEEGFKKVKEMGVDLSTFWSRNDPEEWLQKVADRRRAIAEAKAEAEARAQAEAERKAREEARAKAEGDLAEARRLAELGGPKALTEAKAKLEAALASGQLSARETDRARTLKSDVDLRLARQKAVTLLANAEAMYKQVQQVVADPLMAAGGRGAAGARDALLEAARTGKAAKQTLVELRTLVGETTGQVLDADQDKALAGMMATVDALIARAEAGAADQEARARIEAAAVAADIKKQRERLLAESAVKAGNEAADQGDWARAKVEYLKAVQLDPENQEAARRLRVARRELGEIRGPSIEEVQDIEGVKKERFVLETRRQLNEAHALMRAQEFEKARLTLDRLVQTINMAGYPESDVQDYRAAAEQLRQQALFQIKRQEEQARERDIREAVERERKVRQEFESIRAEKVRQLVAQANAYVKQREYDLGFQAAEEALKLDPSNTEAKIIRDQAQMWGMQTKSEELRHRRDLEIAKMIMDVEESRIPFHAVVTYPEDWVELSARRKKYDVMVLGQQETPAVAKIRQQLTKPVTIEFPNTSFENVIDFLQDLTGVNIVTDRKALITEGITPETTIKLKLNNVRLESALSLILEQVNLDYVIKSESIFITNAEGMGKDLEVRVYDVRDLVVAMGSWSQDNGNDGNGGNGGNNGGNNGSWWGSNGNNGNSNGLRGVSNGWDFGNAGNEGGNEDTAQLMGNLQQLIQQTVAPSTWGAIGAIPGAGQASIEQFRNEMLIISQTPKVHDQIWNLLGQLRAFLSLQVVIEARLIKVDDDFIEDMGIDWDATLNLRDASILPDGTPRPWPAKGADRYAIRNTSITQDKPLTFNPDGTPNTSGPTLVYSPWNVADPSLFPFYSSPFSPVDVNLSLPAVSALTGGVPVLTIGPVGFLDDIAVNFTLAFAQKSFRATVMTAPRVTLMSGGSANIDVTTQERYVSSLRPVVDAGVVGYEPILADAPVSSVSLSINNCAVSHDRRYVRLSINPSLQTAEFEEEKDVFSITVPTGNGAGEPIVLTGTIQRPKVTSTSVGTDVSVPDGGTVLLGGLKTSTEQEQEEGVPVLSKIPIIKRLFTRRFQVRRQTNVILLIKPTIIIPEEEEEKLGLVVD